MVIMTKTHNLVMMVDKNKTEQFLEDSKKNIIKPEFLEECLKIRRMVRKKIILSQNNVQRVI